MYVELDHCLVPGKISDISTTKTLPTGKDQEKIEKEEGYGFGKVSKMLVHKYKIQHGDMNQAILSQNAQRIQEKKSENEFLERHKKIKTKMSILKDVSTFFKKDSKTPKDMPKALSEYEAVAGSTSDDLYYDHDWGFFSAVLACYNNHWVLRTSPDDWWNVIVRNIAQAIDKNGEKNKVRDFYVKHQGKKTIEVKLPGSLSSIDYSSLFNQFSEGICHNIKTPGYVDIIKADFMTTTPDQLIASQIMLMSSLQKYFSFFMSTCCGIPGVEMKGTKGDWNHLVKKTVDLKLMLEPIMNDLELSQWFTSTIDMLKKLVNTFEGNPDKDWWSHILSWNETYGSGARSWWSGWMIDFLMAGEAEEPQDFQSGMVSVPLIIIDEIFGPPVKEVGTTCSRNFWIYC